MSGADAAESSPSVVSLANTHKPSRDPASASVLSSRQPPAQSDPLSTSFTLDLVSLNTAENTLNDAPKPDTIDPHQVLRGGVDNARDIGPEPQEDQMSMLKTVDPISTQEESQDLLPEHEHELKRVKVYELIGSRWIDQGTAFCFGQFSNDSNEAFLIARAEADFDKIILSTAIRSNDVYQRQQDTLIVWTEPDGVDYALSFQDPDGCAEVWNFILEVQRHMATNDPNAPPPTSPLGPEITPASILRSGQLPSPQLGIAGDVDRAIKALARTQNVKEKICEYIQREEYIKAMIEVMNQAEDLEQLDELHALCSLMQTILMLNDHSMYEHILEDDIFFGVVGMLEYDPEFPTHKANYREFLHQTSRFHQPIPIRDEIVQKKVHHTYRLQFLKDVVLARALDDSTFNVLNSCIIFNQIDIINHVQQDLMFLREVVSLYASPDAAPGLDKEGEADKQKMDADPKPNGESNVNGGPPNGALPPPPLYPIPALEESSEVEMTLRREVVLLIQQLCVMGKNVQLPARMALFRTLVDRGILVPVQWAFSLSEKEEQSRAMISAAGEIMAALLDHDLNGVRGHVLRQLPTIEKAKEDKKTNADKTETLLVLMCRVLAQSRELAVQSQVGDALKVLMEIPQNDGPEPPSVMSVKILARVKDEPGTERFLEYFYKNCIDILFQPFTDIPVFTNLPEPLRLSREKTNLFLHLCDLLCNFAQQHGFRSHFYMLSSQISSRVASLLSTRDKHLRLASFRFFRISLKLNNRNFLNHLMKLNVLKPILDLTLQESRRDSLLSSSCQEFFEHMRRENIKDMINHCMTKHEAEIRKLAETPLGGPRFTSFIRRWEMNVEPPPKEEPQSQKAVPDARRLGRAMEAEEEDYFNADDDEEDNVSPAPSSVLGRGQPSPFINNSLKRKPQPRFNAQSKSLRPQNLKIARAPSLGSLSDYGDDDEDSTSGPGATANNGSERLKFFEQLVQGSPLSPSIDIPPSPRLLHRQIPPPLPIRRSPSNDEDNLLESLLRTKSGHTSPSVPSSTPPSKLPSKFSMTPMRFSEKRRREDDDDELLERLATKAKRPDVSGRKMDNSGNGRVGSAKSGDDPPPKKIKLKFGTTSLASAPSTPFTPVPSEPNAKDGDTG